MHPMQDPDGLGCQPPQMPPQLQAQVQKALCGLLQAMASLLKLVQQATSPQTPAQGPATPFNLPLMPQQCLPVQGQQGADGAKGPPPSGVPGAPNRPPMRNDKPTDPNKTVDDYLNANHGLLRNLGNQEGVKDKLKARYGDWDDPKRSEAERRQSAYNAARHVGMCQNKNCWDGTDRGDVKNSGKLDGATKDGDIRAGTPMAALKDSLKGGSPEEQDRNTQSILGDPNLARTKDSHVRKNGTNKDNFQWACGEASKALFFIPGLSNVLKGIGDSEGGFLGALKGGLGGVVKTWTNCAEGVLNSLESVMKGRGLNPATLCFNMYAANIKNNEQSPEWAKQLAGMV
jgi:hypothetical protein